MENEILLLGKKIFWEQSQVLLDYRPDENWQAVWDAKLGHWECKDGYLIGSEPGNFGGILLSKQSFADNVMMRFKMSTVLPATRDLNAVFCTTWDDSVNYLKKSYVVGLNGWYEHKSGLEKQVEDGTVTLYSTTSLYHYTPGTEVRMTVGAIDGHSFMFVDDVLISEMWDPDPIIGGHIGFSAYCTKLRIRDIEIREINWRPRNHRYDPEF